MANLQSISRTELSGKVKAAVEQAKGNAKLKGLRPEAVIGVPPWLWGFVLREADLKALSLSDAQSIAEQAARAAGAGAQPAFYLHGGHIIMGFFPDKNINLVKE